MRQEKQTCVKTYTQVRRQRKAFYLPEVQAIIDQAKNIQTMTQGINEINSCLNSLKISSLPQLMKAFSSPKYQDGAQVKEKEKEQNLCLDNSGLCDNEEDELNAKTKNRLGQIFNKTLSQGLKLLQKQNNPYKDVKSYCSQNLVYEIMQLVRINKLKKHKIKQIDQFIKQSLLPYFSYKYPEPPQRNSIISKFVRQVSEVDNNQNDYVHRSGVKFEYCKSGQYNKEIMKFINYISGLYEEPIQLNTKEQQTYNYEEIGLQQLFNIEIRSCFKKVQDAKFKKQKVKGEKDKSFDQLSSKEKVYQQILENNKKFTIKRKDIERFSEKEIESGKLSFKSEDIKQMMLMWCRQLQNTFLYLHQRQAPIRMADGQEKKIQLSKLNVLHENLLQELKIIEKKMKKISQSNYQIQEKLINEEFYQKYEYLSKMESKVGLFSSLMMKNNENFLINYLNALIHGILSAIRKSKDSLKNQIPSLIEFKSCNLLKTKYAGTKEIEIVSLYQELLRTSQRNPKMLQIIKANNEESAIKLNMLYRNKIVIEMQLRVGEQKQKFNYYMKELEEAKFGTLLELCSIWMRDDPKANFYREKAKNIKCQTNLRRESQQRQKQKQRFRHIVVEDAAEYKQKSQSEKEQELKFFRQEIIHKNKQKHICEFKGQQAQLPFKCSKCQKYYYDFSQEKMHGKCSSPNCQSHLCYACTKKNIKSYLSLKEQFRGLPDIRTEDEVKVVQGGDTLPQLGIIINLQQKNHVPHIYKMINYKKSDKLLLVTKDKGKVRIIHEIQNNKKVNRQNKIRELYQNNLVINIVKTNNEMIRELLGTIEQEKVLSRYYLQQAIRQTKEHNKESLVLYSQNIKDEDILQLKGRVDNIRNMNINCNKIRNINKIGKIFPSLHTLKISTDNKNITQFCIDDSYENIQELFLQCTNLRQMSITNNSTLRVLDLSNNKHLKKLLHIDKCQNLQYINISNTLVQQLNIQDCRNLKYINIENTDISTIQVDQLDKLQYLNINYTPIQEIPVHINNCKMLKYFHLSETKITNLPPQISQCKELQELNLGYTKIREIKPFIGELKKLRILNLSNCKQLQTISQEIGQCENMELLNISLRKSKCISIPNNLFKFRKLQTLRLSNIKFQFLRGDWQFYELKYLDLQGCGIKEFPTNSLKNCKKLVYLDLSQNGLQRVPTQIKACTQLKTLIIDKMGLNYIPQHIFNLKTLQSLSISDNEIRQLSTQIYKLSNLKYLYANFNKIQHIPNQISNLSKLKELYLFGNDLKYLPNEMGKLSQLEQLDLGTNRIQHIPQSITQLQQLRWLNLSENRIKQLPSSICNLKQLMILQLKQNKIEQLPQSIHKLTNLKELHIDQYPLSMKKMQHIKYYTSY